MKTDKSVMKVESCSFAIREKSKFEIRERGREMSSKNSSCDELMNAKLNAGMLGTSDIVEDHDDETLPVATVIGVETTTETKTSQESKEEEEVSTKEEETEEEGSLNMLENVTCFKMKQIFKLKEHYSDWKYVSLLNLASSV